MNSLLQVTLIPAFLAVLSLLIPKAGAIRTLFAGFSWLQTGIVIFVLMPVLNCTQVELVLTPDLTISRLGAYFVLATNAAMACCLTQAIFYFDQDAQKDDLWQMKLFYLCSCLFQISMTAIYFCNNLGFLWICIESATLSSAPLVYFNRDKGALEATWKYLIICSVGIAFALLGTIFIFASSQAGNCGEGSLNISELMTCANSLNFPLLRLGFIFCVIGYGTKAGMFPLHNWLPDAYAESPAPASAMLSGAFLNCALFGIWRVAEIVNKAGHHLLVFETMSTLGAITALFGSLFLLRQHSLKRMWAYSSIENVGIIFVAISLGSSGLFFLQALNHSIAKVALFLLSGNITQASKTQRLKSLHGVLSSAPSWGALLALASLAICGLPPFGSFVSEISILSESFRNHGGYAVVFTLLTAVSISFVAIAIHVGRILVGMPRADFKKFNPVGTSLMPAILVIASLVLGITVRPEFMAVLK